MFPYYLSIGMSYAMFWYEDPLLVIPYRQADKMRWNRFNIEAWLQGRYNFVAVSTALNNAFSKKRIDYPKEPVDIMEKTEEEQKIADQKAKEQVMEQLGRMVAMQQRNKHDG